ncbi:MULTISPECIES: DUF4239 domain-containing protein [unclassified Mesorhizobium]|uniref:bestrophin-like domain n=1 Tax=unclassified Mesorhizobium TaxID=325217 RepID=UPI001126F68C|nr:MULTISPECIES: DUF4239 domain-containing protein [unclassified Mesorhizobium]MBZ9974317.1 DUF4239 domain-containing protein [Mesorhizobium sp. BR-1-1-10]TPK10194.1 DUF4239 domain-containing protein [Mesorhizobium sp. B2-5-7]
MVEVLSAIVVFLLLCVGAGLGILIRGWLPAQHQTPEATLLMQLTVGLLATFAAVVLGLLTASVKQAYDNSALDRQQYALQLDLMDACLHDYGTDAARIRVDLAGYTAAAIASTWPNEARPTGVSYPDTSRMPVVGATPELEELMNKIGLQVNELMPADPQHTAIAAMCRARYDKVSTARLGVIEAARSELLQPFYGILIVWLMIIFACHGLIAPRTKLTWTLMLLSAISLSSVMFVIADLSQPYGGFFSISSVSMRRALQAMLARTS